MKILLAPMEGVIDHHMRETLTGLGGYDLCVTEFLRLSDQLPPPKVFHRLCPELQQGCRTASGTPVFLQLLGGDATLMAESAQRAAELGAYGIDLNFGCPSRFVNRKEGGAVLLREPERVHAIVAAVRRAVPSAIPVSAKMRLGYDDTALALDNAQAIETAGAAFLTVHARTRADGYKAPARWEWLGRLREALALPLVANGDIHSVEEYRRCLEVSGCEDVMLARGAIACPDLARQLRRWSVHEPLEPLQWTALRQLIYTSAQRMQRDYSDRHIAMRIKQWLNLMRQRENDANAFFREIREIRDFSQMDIHF